MKAMQDSVCLCFHINAVEYEWVCCGMNWCGIRPGLLLFQLLLFIFIGCWAAAVVRFMCREKNKREREEEIKIFAIKYFRPLVIYEFLWHTILAWHNYQSLWGNSLNGPTIKWIMHADRPPEAKTSHARDNVAYAQRSEQLSGSKGIKDSTLHTCTRW